MANETPKSYLMLEIDKEELREIIREENAKSRIGLLNLYRSQIEKENRQSFLTIKQTCEYLHVSRQTIYNWTKRGVLKKCKIQGRSYIKKPDIDELSESGIML